MTEEKTAQDQAKILASVGSHASQRFATPAQVAEDMEARRSKYPTKRALAEAYSLTPTMVDRFLSLLKLPEEIRTKVTFQGKGDNLGLAKAFCLARLRSQSDMQFLANEILKSDLNTSEVRQIELLKRKNDALPIEECLRIVRDYREKVEETNVVVATLTPDSRTILDRPEGGREDVRAAVKTKLTNLVKSPKDVRYLSQSGGKLILVLSSEGYGDLRGYAAVHKKTFTELLNDLIEKGSGENH